MRTDKIYLVGFMGAGKSTVARRVAHTLGWTPEDTDRQVEALEHRTIAEIFADRGEPYFRDVERNALKSLIGMRHAVVATGGGTFVDATNRALINEDGASVWLDVSFETLSRRIPSDGRRPLAGDDDTMRTLWLQRRAAYAQAHLHLKADTVPVAELVRQIVTWAV